MTWPWRTSFSAAAAVASLATAALATDPALTTVTGQVQLSDSREPSVSKEKNYSGVVVWLEPVGRHSRLPRPSTYTIVQKGKRFTPHVLVIPVGGTVDFPNFDPIFHNAFSNFAGQPFDTGLYRPGTSQKVQFRRDGVVRVFCNIHSNMSAVIVVVNTPHYAVSKADGSYQMEGVPEGEYTLNVWHERATEASLAALNRRVAVTGDSFRLPAIGISESGYLEIPHKNKHGKEYPKQPPDTTIYPGGRK
jgi:hypothetical protein